MKNSLLIFTTMTMLLLVVSCGSFTCEEAFPANMDLDSVNEQKQAMDGLDVVACYNKTEVKVGSDEFTSAHNGVQYKFMSQDHKNLFDANPEKYMPQIGGYCIVAAAHGKVQKVDNKHYGVYKGKLYFATNKMAYIMWTKGQEKITSQGESMFPCLVSEHGRKI